MSEHNGPMSEGVKCEKEIKEVYIHASQLKQWAEHAPSEYVKSRGGYFLFEPGKGPYLKFKLIEEKENENKV